MESKFAAEQKTLTARLGTTAATLRRKAIERAASAPPPAGESLEDIFPTAASPASAADGSANGEKGRDGGERANASEPMAATSMPDHSGPPLDQGKDIGAGVAGQAEAWSEEDERNYQALLHRRKAEGYQRRGRDISAQQIIAGAIKPNPGTVVATIVALVSDRGQINRAELLDKMAVTSFPNAKARADDRGWCQGYVAGALRDGFLALVKGDGNGGRASNEVAA